MSVVTAVVQQHTNHTATTSEMTEELTTPLAPLQLFPDDVRDDMQLPAKQNNKRASPDHGDVAEPPPSKRLTPIGEGADDARLPPQQTSSLTATDVARACVYLGVSTAAANITATTPTLPPALGLSRCPSAAASHEEDFWPVRFRGNERNVAPVLRTGDVTRYLAFSGLPKFDIQTARGDVEAESVVVSARDDVHQFASTKHRVKTNSMDALRALPSKSPARLATPSGEVVVFVVGKPVFCSTVRDEWATVEVCGVFASDLAHSAFHLIA